MNSSICSSSLPLWLTVLQKRTTAADWATVAEVLHVWASLTDSSPVNHSHHSRSIAASTLPLVPPPWERLSPVERSQLLTLSLALLTSGALDEARRLAPVFQIFGTAALQPLHQLLTNPEMAFETRWLAGQVLAKLHCPAALEILVQCLEATDELTQAIAVQTLHHCGSAELEILLDKLATATAASKPHLVRAIAQICDPAVIDPLLGLVQDANPAIRLMAIAALSTFDDARILAILQQSLRDPVAAIRKEALISLGAKLGQAQLSAANPHASLKGYKPEHSAPNYTPGETSDHLDHRSHEAWLKLFEPLLLDLNVEVGVQAVVTIGRLGTTAAIARLIKLLQSPLTPPVQQYATIRALVMLDQPIAVVGIGSIWSDPYLASLNPQLEEEVVRSLGRLRSPQSATIALQLLLENLNNSGLISRPSSFLQTLAYSLGELGKILNQIPHDQPGQDQKDQILRNQKLKQTLSESFASSRIFLTQNTLILQVLQVLKKLQQTSHPLVQVTANSASTQLQSLTATL